jgi:Uncharacterized protein conserved in bacteria (DUF2188)
MEPSTSPRKIIYVVSFGDKWKVKCDHCNDEVKDTKVEAIRAAKLHVGAFPKGILSQIVVQGTDGKFITEWTYGKDPFPPAG